MEKILCRAASGLSEAGFPFMISQTMSLVVMVQESSGSISLPSVPMIFFGFFPFLPAGNSAPREYLSLGAVQKRFIKS